MIPLQESAAIKFVRCWMSLRCGTTSPAYTLLPPDVTNLAADCSSAVTFLVARVVNVFQWIAIVLACTIAAATYGVANDLVTAFCCIEFFRLFHIDVQTSNPIVIAVVYGVLSTWWVGVILGVIVASSARLGGQPRVDVLGLVRPLGLLVLCVGITAIVFGLGAYLMATPSRLQDASIKELFERLPVEKHRAAFAVNGAHLGAYIAGIIGSVMLSIRTIVVRSKGLGSPNLTSLGSDKMDPLAIVATIGAGLKLVDQFRDMVLRFRTGSASTPSGVARQQDDTIVIKESGHVVGTVTAATLKLDEWDSVRYDAINKRVSANWKMYYSIEGDLPTKSGLQKAQDKIELENLQKELCKDFREMIRLYERAMGVSLPDHYSLYEVCG